MAAALRRLVLPTITRRLIAPRRPLPSLVDAGTGKAAQQGHRLAADRRMIRHYGTEDTARQDRKSILKDAWINLAVFLGLCSVYGADLAHEYYWSPVQYEHDFPEDDDA